ncbi:NmrA family transcriptional regulator [Saccharomonospora piscinae]|uniref:NmrA family transcriptional regulator n=1 Tax=Saccharomonospora piscinae TaxID=687388 RepID=A0A1V9ADF0_SACPI|nr:NAD(P)H-binding protein [Saccharomonospora piscinae]OQO95058.1 NmrA family transcriptional regulator [Saccharomonospora piscinae]
MIVVTGATGNVGRPLVRALAEAGERVTAVARRITEVPEGVRCCEADLFEPESLRDALEKARDLFLLTPGSFMAADGRLGGLLDIVRSSGVQRVVLLSSQGVATQRHPRDIEDAVVRSGLEWTILRPSGFYSNALRWSEEVRARRVVRAPFGDVGLPLVDPADVAEVAAVALRCTGHERRTHTLTGPEAISPRMQAAVIGAALAEPVRFAEQSRAEAREMMLRGMPEPVVETTLDILGEPTRTEQLVNPEINSLLGRRARTFAEWTSRALAAFK